MSDDKNSNIQIGNRRSTSTRDPDPEGPALGKDEENNEREKITLAANIIISPAARERWLQGKKKETEEKGRQPESNIEDNHGCELPVPTSVWEEIVRETIILSNSSSLENDSLPYPDIQGVNSVDSLQDDQENCPVRPQPGAYRDRPGGTPQRVSSSPEMEQDVTLMMAGSSRRQERQQPPSTEQPVLAHATLVQPEDDSPRRKERILWMVAFVVLIVIVGAVVAALLIERQKNNGTSVVQPTTPEELSTTAAPIPPQQGQMATSAPTTIFEEFRNTLPDVTDSAIDTEYTPQSKAFQWLTSHNKQLPLFQGKDYLARMAQRFALATLYYATNNTDEWATVDGWYDSTGWLKTNVDECNWFGCHCTSIQSSKNSNPITALDVSSNALYGTIPLELSLLSTTLEHLNLAGNSLMGPIPTEFGLLSKLTYLDVFGNQLSQSIPSQLGSLSNLESLQLYYNLLTGPIPTELGLLTKLTSLWLSQNQLSQSIPTELGELTLLQELWLDDNRLEGQIPSELGRLTDLYGLSLYENQLNGSLPMEVCKVMEDTAGVDIDCDLVHCNCSCNCL